MKQRQDLADVGYFSAVAEAMERSAAKMWAAVPRSSPDRARDIALTGLQRTFEALVASYSAGASAEAVIDGSLELAARSDDLTGSPSLTPSRTLQIAAFVAIGAPAMQRRQFARFLDRCGEADGVAHTVWLAEEISDVEAVVSHPGYRSGVSDAVELWASGDPEAAVQRLRAYIRDEWYNNHSDTGWHGLHLKSETKGFVGYRCFEAAATVAALSLDDRPLVDLAYYPGELVAAGRQGRAA